MEHPFIVIGRAIERSHSFELVQVTRRAQIEGAHATGTRRSLTHRSAAHRKDRERVERAQEDGGEDSGCSVMRRERLADPQLADSNPETERVAARTSAKVDQVRETIPIGWRSREGLKNGG